MTAAARRDRVGQPPDVAFGGMQTLETLQYSGKASDLSAPIPEQFFTKDRLDAMGDIVQKSVLRNGHPTIFPIWRYAYGGFILANNEMLKSAGFDDENIRKNGWTIDQFREARKITPTRMATERSTRRDRRGRWCIFNIFCSTSSARESGAKRSRRTACLPLTSATMDDSPGSHAGSHQAPVHAVRSAHQRRQVLEPGVSRDELHRDQSTITIHRRLGMTFGETPWVPRTRRKIWEADVAMGAAARPEPPELTCIWMPTKRTAINRAAGGRDGFLHPAITSTKVTRRHGKCDERGESPYAPPSLAIRRLKFPPSPPEPERVRRDLSRAAAQQQRNR